jgi:hypothetical protein
MLLRSEWVQLIQKERARGLAKVTYKSLLRTILKNRGLWVESEAKLRIKIQPYPLPCSSLPISPLPFLVAKE